ncbi:MAG TPA: VOC family protein [Vicinamibacterales bacterium]|nr:VOC family protein [Vicinamibacterales bacterium]
MLRVGGGVLYAQRHDAGSAGTRRHQHARHAAVRRRRRYGGTFAAMAEGGSVTMPLHDTFWGGRFGMLTDAFGIRWMFSCQTNG